MKAVSDFEITLLSDELAVLLNLYESTEEQDYLKRSKVIGYILSNEKNIELLKLNLKHGKSGETLTAIYRLYQITAEEIFSWSIQALMNEVDTYKDSDKEAIYLNKFKLLSTYFEFYQISNNIIFLDIINLVVSNFINSCSFEKEGVSSSYEDEANYNSSLLSKYKIYCTLTLLATIFNNDSFLLLAHNIFRGKYYNKLVSNNIDQRSFIVLYLSEYFRLKNEAFKDHVSLKKFHSKKILYFFLKKIESSAESYNIDYFSLNEAYFLSKLYLQLYKIEKKPIYLSKFTVHIDSMSLLIGKGKFPEAIRLWTKTISLLKLMKSQLKHIDPFTVKTDTILIPKGEIFPSISITGPELKRRLHVNIFPKTIVTCNQELAIELGIYFNRQAGIFKNQVRKFSCLIQSLLKNTKQEISSTLKYEIDKYKLQMQDLTSYEPAALQCLDISPNEGIITNKKTHSVILVISNLVSAGRIKLCDDLRVYNFTLIGKQVQSEYWFLVLSKQLNNQKVKEYPIDELNYSILKKFNKAQSIDKVIINLLRMIESADKNNISSASALINNRIMALIKSKLLTIHNDR